MGYEIKMFVVEHNKNSIVCQDGWCKVIAMVELCKPWYGQEVCSIINKYQEISKKENKKYFFYDNLSNREFKIKKDKYNEYLPLLPIVEFFEAISIENKKIKKTDGHTYRRYDSAIALLKSFFDSKWDTNDLYVMIYGH